MKLPDYYKIDFKRLIELISPLFIRFHSMLILTWSCIKPMITFYPIMKEAIRGYYSFHSYNGSVIGLLSLLRNRFCPNEEVDIFEEAFPFKIADIDKQPISAVLQTKDESIDPGFLLYTEEDTKKTAVLQTQIKKAKTLYFALKIPNSRISESDKIEQAILSYIPCGSKYEIQTY